MKKSIILLVIIILTQSCYSENNSLSKDKAVLNSAPLFDCKLPINESSHAFQMSNAVLQISDIDWQHTYSTEEEFIAALKEYEKINSWVTPEIQGFMSIERRAALVVIAEVGEYDFANWQLNRISELTDYKDVQIPLKIIKVYSANKDMFDPDFYPAQGENINLNISTKYLYHAGFESSIGQLRERVETFENQIQQTKLLINEKYKSAKITESEKNNQLNDLNSMVKAHPLYRTKPTYMKNNFNNPSPLCGMDYLMPGMEFLFFIKKGSNDILRVGSSSIFVNKYDSLLKKIYEKKQGIKTAKDQTSKTILQDSQ